VLALAHEQAAAKRAQLAYFEAILERYGGRPELASRVLPAELGARVSRAAAEFWEGVVERESPADADAA
jgi:PadR family transcriptional regulator, regulatory protein AphA